MNTKERIHHELCKRRKAKGVTQEELAEAVGVTRQTIIAIEAHKYTPSLCLALKIAKYFDATIEEVFSLEVSVG